MFGRRTIGLGEEFAKEFCGVSERLDGPGNLDRLGDIRWLSGIADRAIAHDLYGDTIGGMDFDVAGADDGEIGVVGEQLGGGDERDLAGVE